MSVTANLTKRFRSRVDTPKPDSHSFGFGHGRGVNYNGVWAGLGVPISRLTDMVRITTLRDLTRLASFGPLATVRNWKVGDEVVIHCNQDDGDDEECNGGDPMYSTSQRIWGYETPDGSFAQFTNVQAQQLLPRPKHLTWEESACYTLTWRLRTVCYLVTTHRA